MAVVFITGGSTGIGAATVRKFATSGDRVAFLDTGIEQGKALVAEFSKDQVLFMPGDVRRQEDLNKAVALTLENFGILNAVFANAGIYRVTRLLDLQDEDIDLVIDVNLKGVLYTMRATVPHLIQAGGGSIVLMASDQAFVGKLGALVYGSTKAGIAQMAKYLALELAPNNIRVNAVCPATIRTPLAEAVFERVAQEKFAGDVEAAWNAEASAHPLGRVGQPEEVAEVVYFLISKRSSFMTGSLIPIDGGFTAR